MTIGGSSPNDSPKPVVSSPWSQIVAATAVPSSSRSPPPVAAAAPSSSPSPPPIVVDSSVVNSAPVEDSDKVVVGHNVSSGKRPVWNKSAAPSSSRSPPPVVAESSVVNSAPAEDSDKAAVGHNVSSGKRPVWNKPSNAASSSIMGADSWPALTDSTKAPSRSPSESGPANMLPTPQRPSMSNMMPSQIHPRPYRHTNSHLSSNGGHPSQLPPPQGPMAAPVSQQQGRHQPRAGFLPNDHPQQRNSSRNRNVVPHQRGDGAHHHPGSHQRGDGAHHHNYGSRRDQDRGNQEWNTHQNFNVRENYMPPRYVPTYMGPPPPPAPLFAPAPTPPPLPHFVSPIGYRVPELPPPLQVVYPPPPMESLRSVPFVPPLPPNAMPQPLESLHNKILKQIDYYFSVENLIRDDYLRGHMDDQGWVSIYFVAGFPKVQNMTQDIQTVLDAVQSSRVIEVQGDKIRKRDDWEKWIIQKDLFSMYSSRSRAFRDLNSQYLLSTSDGTGQVGIQISDHSISARN